MGRFRFTGRDARTFLDRVCTRQVWGMKDGQARYSIVCNERGGCRDDAGQDVLSHVHQLAVVAARTRPQHLEGDVGFDAKPFGERSLGLLDDDSAVEGVLKLDDRGLRSIADDAGILITLL